MEIHIWMSSLLLTILILARNKLQKAGMAIFKNANRKQKDTKFSFLFFFDISNNFRKILYLFIEKSLYFYNSLTPFILKRIFDEFLTSF